MLLFVSLLTPALAAPDSARLRAALDAPSGWSEVTRKHEDDVGEVVIRLKDVDGQPCLEGTTTAALDADRLLEASADIDTQPRWSTWTLPYSRRITAPEGERQRFVYAQVLDNPYPIADRTWFLQGELVRTPTERRFVWDRVDPSTHAATWADVHARFPDAVLTGVNLGDWTFTPQPDGRTRIRYRICTDAGGNIPRWAGEYAATKTLPTNVGDIVREVTRRSRK